MCKNLRYVSIKTSQAHLQKCIVWPKKSKKGRQERTKVCVEIEIHPRNSIPQWKQDRHWDLIYFVKNLVFKLKIVNFFCFYWRLLIFFVLLFYKFASKVIVFQEALLFQAFIVLCYSRQTIVKVTRQVPPLLTCHIY